MECQTKCKFTYGFRRVRQWILRTKGRNVNRKAVLRVMRKLDALAQIRRHRPYVHYKKWQEQWMNM